MHSWWVMRLPGSYGCMLPLRYLLAGYRACPFGHLLRHRRLGSRRFAADLYGTQARRRPGVVVPAARPGLGLVRGFNPVLVMPPEGGAGSVGGVGPNGIYWIRRKQP